MRQTLYGLGVLLLAACSDGEDAAVVESLAPASAQLSASAQLNDDDSIAALLVTEHDTVDGSAFWRCNIQDNAGTTTVGMRLNRDSSGFIAEQGVNWQVVENNTAVFAFDDGYIEFNNIQFEPHTGINNNRFTATEPVGTQVVCDWNGPGRSSATDELQNDPGVSLALLLTSLNTDDVWQCQFPESQTAADFKLTLLPGSIAVIDNEDGSWFLNDRYDLVLQSLNTVTVINQLYYPIGQNAGQNTGEFFSGSIRGEPVNCSR